MVMVNGRRADLELREQWDRNLRAGKDLDYENQLSMLNALNVVCDEYLKVCEALKDRDIRLGLLQGPVNELSALCFAYEISGLLDEKRVYSVCCEMAGTMEKYNNTGEVS